MSQLTELDRDITQARHQAAREVYQRITTNIAKVMQGQAASTRKLLAAFASGGHVLLEDFPGTGKTTLAKALARSVDARFKRIQFTPDLLPARSATNRNDSSCSKPDRLRLGWRSSNDED